MMDIKELVNDEAFKAQLENAKSSGEVIELFKSKGVELTDEMIARFVSSTGELDENSLADVAGGRIGIPSPTFPWTPRLAKWLLDWIKRL